MAQFVNRFWRIVARNYEAMETHAPEGHTALVFAYFVGEPTPRPVGVVESSAEHTWLCLHSMTEGRDDPQAAYPSDRLIFADESQLSRVEICYVRTEPETKHPLGFRLQEASEEDSD